MRQTSICVLVFLSLASNAQAQSTYSAFDLAAKKITLSVPQNVTPGAMLTSWNCMVTTPNPGSLIIASTSAHPCAHIFAARQPGDLSLDLSIPAPVPAPKVAAPKPEPITLYVQLSFDHGISGIAHAQLIKAGLDFQDSRVGGNVVYWSEIKKGWDSPVVVAGSVAIANEVIPQDTDVYWQAAPGNPILVVKREQLESNQGKPADIMTECKSAFMTPHNWSGVLDAANPTNMLQVIQFEQIVEPNAFGLIVVRHSDQLQVSFEGTGSAQLLSPPIYTGVGQNALSPNPNVVNRVLPTVTYVCSTYVVAPRGGTFTLTITLNDPNKTSGVVSARKLDIIVLQRYSGAFRAGVAGVLCAPDQKFEPRMSPSSMQAEIVRTQRTPVELVLGYSVFFSALSGTGRTYFTRTGQPHQDSHGGVYLGFGALSVGGTNSIDYLKSLHLGVEWEFSPYVAVALTGVARRVDELAADAKVGGPAPTSIPIQNRYVLGVGVILNISPSFFKFASNIGKGS